MSAARAGKGGDAPPGAGGPRPFAPPAAASPGARERRVRRLRALGLALLFLAPFVVPLPRGLMRMRWLDVPSDLVHVPLIGLLTWVLHARGPLRGRPLRSALAAVGAGVAIELIQAVAGREASLEDLLLDVSGALAAACWLRLRAVARVAPAAPPTPAASRAAHAWLVGAVVALVPAVVHLAGLPPVLAADALARHRFPLLADFETTTEMAGWYESHDGRIAVVPRDGDGHALRVSGTPPHHYPGAVLRGFPRDWTAYGTIEFDARCVGADSVRFIVRTDDFRANKDGAWLANRFTARPQWARYSWTPGTALGRRPARPQDRRDMHSLTVYLARPEQPVAVELDNLRLR